jgi:hypothetical protein
VISFARGRLREDDRRFFDRTNEQERIDSPFAEGNDLPEAQGRDDAGTDGKEGEVRTDAGDRPVTDVKDCPGRRLIASSGGRDQDRGSESGRQKQQKDKC